jgi:hypothetical protein
MFVRGMEIVDVLDEDRRLCDDRAPKESRKGHTRYIRVVKSFGLCYILCSIIV